MIRFSNQVLVQHADRNLRVQRDVDWTRVRSRYRRLLGAFIDILLVQASSGRHLGVADRRSVQLRFF